MYIYILYIAQIITHTLLVFFLIRKLRENKSFLALIVFNISIILWVIFEWLLIYFYDQNFVIWFVRGTFASASIIVGSFLIFVRYSIKKRFDIKTVIAIIISILAVIFSFTPLLVESVVVGEPSRLVPVNFGSYSYLFIIYILGAIITLLITILKHKKTTVGLEFLRLRYITTSIIVGGLIALATNIIIPTFTGSSNSALLGPIAMSVISLFTTYSYIKNRLFGIRYLFNKFLYFILSTILPTSLILILIFTIEKLNFNINSPQTYGLAILLSIILVVIFPLVKNFLNLSFGNSGENKNPQKAKDIFLKDISTELNIEKLSTLTLNTINQIFSIKKSALFIFNLQTKSIEHKNIEKFNKNPFESTDVLNILGFWEHNKTTKTIAKDDLLNSENLSTEEKSILDLMIKNNLEVVFPLNIKGNFAGLLILGRKNNREPFTIENIKFLESLSLNASIAFSRSLLYSQVEDLNASLKQKVSEQTKELQQKVKLLEEARRKEADMIDIMGHELRTPMSVVKLNTDLLHNFTHNVERRKEDFKKYVKRIKEAVDTEIKLINTLLSSAKLEGDKIELNPEKVDLIKQIDMALHSQEGRAEKKGIQLIKDFHTEDSYVFADHARTVEVISNLIDNAVKYTQKGSVTIRTDNEKEYIRISITDTGLGMTQDDIKNLGKKFYRTGNYTQSEYSDDIDIVRPGGTGLGLYVTFSLVRKMGGEIHVESELGNGSTFTFTLPKYHGQESTPINDSKDMFKRLGLRE
jgi:signal transduction histidine kinase